jgi:hypothetical protein
VEKREHFPTNANGELRSDQRRWHHAVLFEKINDEYRWQL